MNTPTQTQVRTFGFVDLFAGVGGMTVGFLKANTDRFRFAPIVLVDRDSSARTTFQRNFPGVKYLVRDVKTLQSSEITSLAAKQGFSTIDLVIGGPPCQGLSRLADSRLDDPRNELLRVFVDRALELQPKIILMENVPMLLTLEGGALWDDIVARFESWGYAVSGDVLDASRFRIPQTRRRAFILATRTTHGMPRPKLPDPPLPELPFAIDLIRSARNGDPSQRRKFVTVEHALGDLPPINAGEGEEAQPYTGEPKTNYQKARRANSLFLFNHRARNHSKAFLEKLAVIDEGGRNQELEDSARFSDNYYSQAYARLHRHGLAQTITTCFANPGSGRFLHYRDLRSITVREAARLQSFDDAFIFQGDLAAQMRHIGNAVPPLLAFHIARKLAQLFESADLSPKPSARKRRDPLSKRQRSAAMRAVPSHGTKPEIALRRALWAIGLRGWRNDRRDLKGRPDVSFSKPRIALFVDGCYWHGCPKCCRKPHTNKKYWAEKIRKNRERDRKNTKLLKSDGWTVLRFWEHEVLPDSTRVASRVAEAIKYRTAF